MIVADDTVSKALAYLAEDPHPVALARKDVTDSENGATRVYAEVYGEQTGSIKDKEMATERDERVIASRNVISGAMFDLERHKARAKAADMIIEVWRSEQANVRAAERVR